MGLFDEYDDQPKGGSVRDNAMHGSKQNIPYKGARSLSPVAKARLSRVATRTPEVMVKITGHAKNGKQLQSHMDYMTRKSTLTAFNERDDLVSTSSDLERIREDWLSDTGESRKNARLTTNIALSIPNGDREALLKAGRAFAAEEFDGHDYLIVMHTDTDHPHLHLTVRNRREDGTRLHVPKGRTQEWRESFASHLRSNGIEAEATSRAERGVVRKGDSAGIRHIRDRKTPDNDRSAVADAMGPDKRDDQSQPWRPKIRERQNAIRRTWEKIGDELSEGDAADQQLAKQVRLFTSRMPAVETREDALRREVSKDQGRPSKVQDQAQSRDDESDLER